MADIPDHRRWFPQARFGLFIHWGAYSDPPTDCSPSSSSSVMARRRRGTGRWTGYGAGTRGG